MRKLLMAMLVVFLGFGTAGADLFFKEFDPDSLQDDNGGADSGPRVEWFSADDHPKGALSMAMMIRANDTYTASYSSDKGVIARFQIWNARAVSERCTLKVWSRAYTSGQTFELTLHQDTGVLEFDFVADSIMFNVGDTGHGGGSKPTWFMTAYVYNETALRLMGSVYEPPYYFWAWDNSGYESNPPPHNTDFIASEIATPVTGRTPYIVKVLLMNSTLGGSVESPIAKFWPKLTDTPGVIMMGGTAFSKLEPIIIEDIKAQKVQSCAIDCIGALQIHQDVLVYAVQ